MGKQLSPALMPQATTTQSRQQLHCTFTQHVVRRVLQLKHTLANLQIAHKMEPTVTSSLDELFSMHRSRRMFLVIIMCLMDRVKVSHSKLWQ